MFPSFMQQTQMQLNQPMSQELSKTVRDVMDSAQVPQEFITEPIIEERVIEVFKTVYEKEIVEVPQVCTFLRIALHDMCV